jgi:hypothetical protein
MRQTKQSEGRYYYTLSTYTDGHLNCDRDGKYYHPYLQVRFQPQYYLDFADEKSAEISSDVLFTITSQTEKKGDARCCGRSYGFRVEMDCQYGIKRALKVLAELSKGEADIFTNAMRFLRKKNALRIAHAEYMSLPYKFRKHAKQYAEAVKSGLMKKVA